MCVMLGTSLLLLLWSKEELDSPELTPEWEMSKEELAGKALAAV